MAQHAALIVRRHKDGFNYVPWDEDPHPSREALKGAYRLYLSETGHTYELMPGGHIRLITGPHAAGATPHV